MPLLSGVAISLHQPCRMPELRKELFLVLGTPRAWARYSDARAHSRSPAAAPIPRDEGLYLSRVSDQTGNGCSAKNPLGTLVL